MKDMIWASAPVVTDARMNNNSFISCFFNVCWLFVNSIKTGGGLWRSALALCCAKLMFYSFLKMTGDGFNELTPDEAVGCVLVNSLIAK